MLTSPALFRASRSIAWSLPMLVLVVASGVGVAEASQSSITEVSGTACAGEDRSRIETERAALTEARRRAAEFSATHISSTTVVENAMLKSDLIEAYSQAEVRVLEVLERTWDAPGAGDCFTISIRAEVMPSDAVMQRVQQGKTDDPRLPLAVQLWVDDTEGEYVAGERMKIYLTGNKPFYARLIYVEASGTRVQLLPNQHRSKNYFNGTTMYEVPTPEDGFQLEVSPPFGDEQLVLYASTMPLGDIQTEAAGDALFVAADSAEAISMKTRGVTIASSNSSTGSGVAEFAEADVSLRTRSAP